MLKDGKFYAITFRKPAADVESPMEAPTPEFAYADLQSFHVH
jgi:hypothetical protein